MSNDFALTLELVKTMHASAKGNDAFLDDIAQLLLFKEMQVQQALLRAKTAETHLKGKRSITQPCPMAGQT